MNARTWRGRFVARVTPAAPADHLHAGKPPSNSAGGDDAFFAGPAELPLLDAISALAELAGEVLHCGGRFDSSRLECATAGLSGAELV